jgi:hypothetical protein
MGVSDAVVGGICFSVGVILAGWAIHDVVTLAGGFIALVVLFLAPHKGKGSGLG